MRFLSAWVRFFSNCCRGCVPCHPREAEEPWGCLFARIPSSPIARDTRDQFMCLLSFALWLSAYCELPLRRDIGVPHAGTGQKGRGENVREPQRSGGGMLQSGSFRGMIISRDNRPRRMPIVSVPVQCPYCHCAEVIKGGKQANGTQRSQCQNDRCEPRIFLGQY